MECDLILAMEFKVEEVQSVHASHHALPARAFTQSKHVRAIYQISLKQEALDHHDATRIPRTQCVITMTAR